LFQNEEEEKRNYYEARVSNNFRFLLYANALPNFRSILYTKKGGYKILLKICNKYVDFLFSSVLFFKICKPNTRTFASGHTEHILFNTRKKSNYIRIFATTTNTNATEIEILERK
jgi:hypothetical protein